MGCEANVVTVRRMITRLSQASSHGKFPEFIDMIIARMPQTFAHAASGDAEEETESRLCQAFTCWCVSRVLNLLSDPQCSGLHSKCHATLGHLLHVLKWRDPRAHRAVVAELVNLAADLATAYVKLVETEDTISSIKLTAFSIPDDLVQQSVLIPHEGEASHSESHQMRVTTVHHIVTGREHCEQFQAHVTTVLGAIASHIPPTPCLLSLWNTLCSQLELSEPPLLLGTLITINHLLTVSGLPHVAGLTLSNILFYFIDSLVSVCEMLCQSSVEIQPQILVQLEEEISRVVLNIILADTSEQFVQHLAYADFAVFLQRLSLFLRDCQLSCVKSSDMRSALSKVTCYVLKNCATSSDESEMAVMCRAFVCFVGQGSGDIQFAVGPIVLGVCAEVRRSLCRDDIKMDGAVEEKVPGKRTKKIPDKYRMKCDARSEKSMHPPEVTALSPIYHSLYHQAIPFDPPSMSITNHCTTQAVVEVACHCVTKLATHLKSGDSLASPMPLSTFLHPNDLHAIVQSWYTMLTDSTLSPDSDSCKSCLSRVTTSVAAILTTSVTQTECLEGDLLTRCICLLSLYWMPTESSWYDLKPKEPRKIADLATKLSEHIGSDHIRTSLSVLSLLPKDICPKWRTRVLRLSMSDTNMEVRVAVVTYLPYFITAFKPSAFYLVTELIHPLFCEDDLSQLCSVLVDTVSPLTCSLAQSTTICLKSDPEVDQPVYKNVTLLCDCHDLSPSAPSIKHADAYFIKPFMNLLSTGEDTSQLQFARNLASVFRHIDFTEPNTHTTSLLDRSLEGAGHHLTDVRLAFGETLREIITDGEGQGGIDVKVMNRLVESLEGGSESNMDLTAKRLKTDKSSNGSTRHQESILIVMAALARVSSEEVLRQVILHLLDHLQLSHPVLSSTAFLQLKALNVESTRNTGHNLLVRIRQPLCTAVAEAMYVAKTDADDVNTPATIVTEVAHVLGYPNLQSFLQVADKFLVSHLVSKASPTSTCLISLIAAHLELKVGAKLLLQKTYHIFCYILCHCTQQQFDASVAYLESETKFTVGRMLRMDSQRVLNELLLYLASHHKQVFKGFNILASSDTSYKGRCPITSNTDMANYIQPRLLGFLNFIDTQLRDTQQILKEKKVAMESLIAIMNLMGQKHITVVRIKMMATLRISMQYQDEGFPQLSCRAWNCFVRSIELPSLAPLVPQIIATLLPLVETLPQNVADIINFLIVENKSFLHGNFHEIYFLPDIPMLTNASKILNEYIVNPSSQSELSRYLRGISHDSLDVRLHALIKLRQFLQSNQKYLHQLIIGSDSADPIISQLISTLLGACRDVSSTVRLLVGECLGEIGAIDPGRLELTSDSRLQQRSKFHASITDDNFAFDLIIELVRTFLAASKATIQDCSAYALQELLNIFDIKSSQSEAKPSDSSLWMRFPEDVRDILKPLFTSKYLLPVEKRWTDLKKPICKSAKGGSFADWVTTWSEYLISKVKQEKARRVLMACAVVVRHNVDKALYLLPYIVFYVLVDGEPEDSADVHEEIMEVMNLVREAATRHGTARDFRHMSAQTVFSILDHLTKWQRDRIQALTFKTQPKVGAKTEPAYLSDKSYRAIRDFVERVPGEVLSEASYNCGSYTRSLMHYEQYIQGKDIQEHLNYLQRLYAMLDEPDGMAGVTTIRKAQPTLQEQVLAHESNDELLFALSCYERAIQLESTVSHHEGLLKSYMQLGHHSAALLHTSGLLTESPQWKARLNSYRIEAAWKLSSWEQLETYINQEKKSSTHNWSLDLGRVLLSTKKRAESDFLSQMTSLRSELMNSLSPATMETASYLRAYDYILKLHQLTEVEQMARGLLTLPHPGQADLRYEELFGQWEARFKMAQCTFRAQEPILTLRKTLLTLVKAADTQWAEAEIGHSWLKSAKAARKAGQLQSAHNSLVQASSYNVPQFYIEKAKLLWQKGDQVGALSCLEKGTTEYYRDKVQIQSGQSQVDLAKRLVYARILLLYARYSEESSTLESHDIIMQYKEAISVAAHWEQGHFYLGRYYDKILTKLINDKGKLDKQGEFTLRVIKNFASSLHHGNQFIYQSLPRMLSLWLDYGSSVVDTQKRASTRTQQLLNSQQKILTFINETIANANKTLCPYQLFTAFPQLVSRICHAHPDVSSNLQNIIANLFVSYPQQAMWLLTAVSKSSYAVRGKRCKEIFARATSINPELHKFISDSTKLSERLLDLCEKETPRSTMSISLAQHFRHLKRLFEDSHFSHILIPQQVSMTVTLPTNPGSHPSHDPFPTRLIYIRGLEDTIDILNSLQRPKKITLQGSDGHFYVMMCKPKDDLRRDCRLMDFTTIVNKFLRKDAESRRRQLHIRTFAVIPLNEECGMVEWINNTSGLRNILLKFYKEKGMYMSGKELQAAACHLTTPLADKLKVYRTKLLPRHPPVFSEWFSRMFPDPTSWYMARLSYARTTAVMSMVGYILGLGDRHGENILFDSTTGDCVHVDFNCLFNKGETFEWPEKVPFRLTHNMVAALGPMGQEGVFRQACEVVLRVMRNQSDSLMSVLRPFVYDPLVEWSKSSKGRTTASDTGEITNDEALKNVQSIENRLKGVINAGLLPLSIEGHVNYLIKVATDETNLCQMYVGWAAYM